MKIALRLVWLALAATPVLLAQPAPTPEPGTTLLIGTGLAALGLLAWRRYRR